MPASWVSVLVFICFVAPGFYFEQISRSRRVRAKESAFQEVSRTVLGSVAIGIPAGLAAFGTWLVVTDNRSPDFVALLRWESAYVGSHFGSLLAGVLGYLAASVLIARLANYFATRRKGATLVSAHTLWTELFRVRKGPHREAVVKVVMKSGHSWSGIVGNFSADHEADDRELVLYRPILYSATAEDPPVLQRQDVLVLRGAEISSIGINYTTK
ncbi:DUF6338 family protein (plasmid) [Arthrobacter sp. Z1-9]